MIIGICARARTGKDHAADYLVEHHRCVKLGIADPIRRLWVEITGCDPRLVWGPSEGREEPIPHLFRPDGEPLTSRHGLQHLGTEGIRAVCEDAQADTAVRAAYRILVSCEAYHGPFGFTGGEYVDRPRGVVINDVRFRNEVRIIQRAGGHVVLIDRAEAGLRGEAGEHKSEALDIPREMFDDIYTNNGTLRQLESFCDGLAAKWLMRAA